MFIHSYIGNISVVSTLRLLWIHRYEHECTKPCTWKTTCGGWSEKYRALRMCLNSNDYQTKTNIIILKYIWNHKRSRKAKASLSEESDSLNSDYTTKLQWSKQCVTGTKPEIYINGAEKSPEIYTLMVS